MTTKKDERLVISVEEAAHKLGISRDSAYKAVRSGELPVIRIGGLLRVPTVQLNRLLSGER